MKENLSGFPKWELTPEQENEVLTALSEAGPKAVLERLAEWERDFNRPFVDQVAEYFRGNYREAFLGSKIGHRFDVPDDLFGPLEIGQIVIYPARRANIGVVVRGDDEGRYLCKEKIG